MTLRRRALLAFVALGALAAGTGTVVARARAERERTLALFTAIDRTERQLAQLDQCLHDHHRQMTLVAQTFSGATGQGIETELKTRLVDAGTACRAVATALAREGGDPESAEQRRSLEASVGALVDDWTFVIEHLGVDHVAAITRQATQADPRSETLLSTTLPTVRATQIGRVEEARDRFLRTGTVTDRTILLAVLASLATAGLVQWFVLQRVVSALGRLQEGADRFGRSEFGHRIAQDGNDEFTSVIGQVNAMAARIADNRVELQRRADDLQNLVDILRSARDTLVHQEKMAALGELVAGVAHEVNTPLGVAVTTSSMIQDQLVALRQHAEAGTATRGLLRRAVGDAEEAVGLLVDNVRRAAELVRSFKQVAVDRSEVATRAAALREWIHALVQSLSPLARQHRVTVRVEVPEDASLVLAAGELEQVVTNLLVNAFVHAYGDGEGAPADRPVLLTARVDPTHLTIRVEDRGRGMAPDVAARVYEPFFTTRRGSGGTGLGMHVVHQLVQERFAGDIALRTQPGEGTCWTVRLPFGTAALQQVPQAGEGAP